MITRPAEFDTLVREGGVGWFNIAIQRKGSLLIPRLPVTDDASITLDGSAAVVRTLTMSVADEDGSLTPSVAADALSPYGSEAVVTCGFLRPDGTTLTVPAGVYRLAAPRPGPRRIIPMTGSDRSVVVTAARFERPYAIAKGTNLGTAIFQLIDSRYPGLTYSPALFNGVTTTQLPGAIVFSEGDSSGDPWTNALDLARSDGLDLFFDAVGRPTLRAIPNPAATPSSWDYQPGVGSLLVEAHKTLASEGVPNVAVVTGEGSGVTPVRASVEITDTASPLHPSNLGRRPVFLTSPLIATAEQALRAARGLLLRKATQAQVAEFVAAPHPAHEPSDVVLLRSDDAAINERVVLRSWTLGLNLRTATTYQTYPTYRAIA